MSQTTTEQPAPRTVSPEVMQYLMAQTSPKSNNFVVDPKYHNMTFVTPVGRLAYVHVAAPHAINVPGRPAGRLRFTATLLMAPGTGENPILADLHRAICMVADAHWPAVQRADPQSGQIVTVPGSQLLSVPENLGGLNYPLRSGDENYVKEPQKFGEWRGLWFVNSGMDPKSKSGMDQRPWTLDERGELTDPAVFYPGCFARLNLTIYPFANESKGVALLLNGIQFAKHGERMIMGFDRVGAGRASMAAAGALPVAEPMTPQQGGWGTGFGPNSATPGNVPPGMAVPGFAAPPPPQQVAPPAAQPASAPIPPQQPWTPAQPTAPQFGGARPPGV